MTVYGLGFIVLVLAFRVQSLGFRGLHLVANGSNASGGGPRANSAQIRQSRPESGLGCQIKVLQNLSSCSILARKRRGSKDLVANGSNAPAEEPFRLHHQHSCSGSGARGTGLGAGGRGNSGTKPRTFAILRLMPFEVCLGGGTPFPLAR